MAEVEHLQIRLQKFSRNFLIELLTCVMALLQETADRHGNRFSRRRQWLAEPRCVAVNRMAQSANDRCKDDLIGEKKS